MTVKKVLGWKYDGYPRKKIKSIDKKNETDFQKSKIRETLYFKF